MHGKHAELSAGERKRVDPVELVLAVPCATIVGAAMESLGRRKHRCHFAERRRQILGRQEPWKDHEPTCSPFVHDIARQHPCHPADASPGTQSVFDGPVPAQLGWYVNDLCGSCRITTSGPGITRTAVRTARSTNQTSTVA
jgi:hypothetical protein